MSTTKADGSLIVFQIVAQDKDIINAEGMQFADFLFICSHDVNFTTNAGICLIFLISLELRRELNVNHIGQITVTSKQS